MRKNYLGKYIRYLTIMLLAAMTSHAWCQKVTRFTGDSTKFVGELNSIFFNLTDNEQKIIAPCMLDFVQKWNTEQFSPSRKKLIYTICNEMLKKRLRAFPDFFNYINALNTFLNSHQPDASFYPWSDILKKLITDKNSRYFVVFVESTLNLFGENLVYKSPSTRWKIINPNYRFIMDSVPVIDFSQSDLVCYANDDSLNIYQTKGLYFPLSNRWNGNGGKVNWKRAGQDPVQIYADLGRYEIQMKFSKFIADSVGFIHKKYFSAPIVGRYIDKILADVTEDKSSYPRFYSYDKLISISNLFRNIDYLGGFAIEGARIVGSGDRVRDARLFFKKDGKDFVIARSKSFVIRTDRINSGHASITIYHDNDSIYHPGLQMKYIDEKKELSFTKDERITSISPWFDSFHGIEIYCEALNWKVDEAKINFEMMKGPTKESKAVFESSSYYSLHRYERLRGIDEINPLNLIKQYTEQRKSNEFTLDELTSYMQKPPEQVEVQLLTLANRGFLVYDDDDKTAKVKNKLIDYVKARDGKQDYDVIFFNSDVTGTSNGILNLETFDLKLQGVPSVFLSDSQQVVVYPKNNEVILKKDMDFKFSGKIEGGLFDFYARDCSFEYRKFKINLPFIDSMAFYVRSKTWDPKSGKFPLVRVRTVITNLSGDLLIDDPKNKSGLMAMPQYPIFNDRDTALVNWDKRTIHKGVYKKDKFFYKVYPFTIHSLDVVATDSLDFPGFLCSSGIFPDIEEPLKVRPDYSLGLEKVTEQTGLPAYGGKGTFTNRVDLSDRGLRGDGTFHYLNSTSYSADFLFFPDSMRTLARSFAATEQLADVEYPAVQADSVNEFWLPYRDSLIISTTKKEMAMYNQQSSFAGRLSLTPRELSGNGTVKIKDAEMDSKGFSFKRRTFDALIANFRIKSYDLADLTISTRNYQTHFDFDKRRGEFKSNIGISKVEFPFNKYVCSMDRFDWLIDNEEITLSNEQSKRKNSDSLSLSQLIDLAYTGSEFVSIHPLQDSLRFFAAKARYNLRTNVINAEEARIIKVADAAVYPDSGKVVIFKDAQMQTLRHAIVIANTKSRFHNFYNANISIASRKKYTGMGDYDYKDRLGNFQKIHFSKMYVDTTGQTNAEGAIPDSIQFKLSPEFAFAGEVFLKADQKNLEYDGGFRIITDCLKAKPSWVKFRSVINPQHVQIPIAASLKNSANENISLAMAFSNTDAKIYPLLFSRKNSFSDSTMATSDGLIEFNPPTTEFRIAKEEKLKNIGERGKYLSLNTTNCMVRAEGKINTGMNSGNLKMESYGTLDYFIIPDSTRMNLAIAFNFPFSDAALQKFSTQVESINLTGVSIARTPYLMAMESLIDEKETERLKSEIELVGKFRKFPESLERTLFFADVRFRYDSSTSSYVSYGPIGIGSVGKIQVNRYVTGTIELTKKRNGDDFTIFLKLTQDDWYFFNFRNNILQVLSSNLEFNDLITEALKSKTEQNRVDKQAKGFRYTLSTERKKREFLRKFEKPEE